MDLEEYFPRGSQIKRPNSEKSESSVKKKIKLTVEEPDLFKEGPRVSKEKFISKEKLKSDVLFLPEVIAAEMLVLGCVAEIRDFEMVVSLPNGMYGTVGIANVCSSYTSLLEQLTNDGNEEQLSRVPSLEDLFYVGKLVRCKVIDVTMKDRKRVLTLSLNPAEVNSLIKQLKSGMVLTGCVSSAEDHGYVIDLGIRNVNAFVKTRDAEVYLKQLGGQDRLHIGSYLHCLIGNVGQQDDSDDTRVANVVIDPQQMLAAVVDSSATIKLQCLLPGTVCMATIKKAIQVTQTDPRVACEGLVMLLQVLKDSVKVALLSYDGVVHQFHLKSPIDQYKTDQQIKVTVLYMDPTSKILVLSELIHLTNPNRTQVDLFGSLAVGDVISEAVVLWANAKHGAFLRLPDKQRAFVSIQNAPTNFPKKVKTLYCKGTSHTCRVLRFNLVDRLAVVSLKKSVIKQPFLSYADIKPATVLRCTVRNIHPKGVSVDVAHNIFGIIPRIHLAEMLLKHPEKKFLPGKKLKCKVLSVDPSKNKLVLTHKKSLVQSESVAVTSYEECKEGRVIEGFIADIKRAGIVVVFYNNVKGFVQRRELTEQRLDFPEKLFYLGQTVKCRVLSCNPDEEKLAMSLRVGVGAHRAKVAVQVPENWSVGKILSCQVKKVGDAGLDVELTPGSLPAFLPKVHLSDHHSNYDLVMSSYVEGDIIDRVMFIGVSGGIIVTRKESLIKSCQNGGLVSDFSGLKLGMLAVGTLKRKMSYGVFIDLLNGLTGLAPTKYLLDRRHPDPSSLLHEGQTLTAKISEVDAEKNRFLVSLRPTDCFHGNSEVGLQLLSNYLTEYYDAIERIKSIEVDKSDLLQLAVGHIVKVQVTAVSESGVLCQLHNGVKGFITLEHMPGIVGKVGENRDAVVLHVDSVANCVQLTFSKDVIKAVQNYKENKFTQVCEGQRMKSEVQLVTDDFVLVLLKGHAAGKFAYLPARRHLNDFMEKHQFTVTQINNIIVKRVEARNRVLANLETNETVAAAAGGKTKSVGEMPSIGTIAVARVRQVYDLQLNVSVNGFAGRVYITEVADNFVEGARVLENYQEGSELKIKVIGYRTLQANKYLPITQADHTQVLLECTAKPSKLLDGNVESASPPKVGDKIAAYVSSYKNHLFLMQLTPKVPGKLHLLNASDDIEVLKKAVDHFKVGSAHWVKVISGAQGNRHGSLELSIAERESELKPGRVVPALVLSVIKNRGLHVQLPCGQVGDAYLTDLSDEYQDQPESNYTVDQFVKCCIVQEVVGSRRKWTVSLRQSRLCDVRQKVEVVDPEITGRDQLSVGQVCRGFVVCISDSGVLVSFSTEVVGKIPQSRVQSIQTTIGSVVTTRILAIDQETGHIRLELIQSMSAKKLKAANRKIKECVDLKEAKIKVEEDTNINDRSCLSVPFTWDNSFSVPLPESVDSSDSDSDMKSTVNNTKTKVKKLTGRDKEKLLYEAETRLAQTDLEPQSKQDFERLVFQSPHSSMCWLRYAAMHIAETDIDSAREVFKRALQAIPASDELERLNVWTAYLNTEFLYGSQTAVDELITWGTQHADPVEAQRRVISMYERAGKLDLAEDIHKKLLITCKSEASTWINYISFLYVNNRLEAGRKLISRAMLSVDKKRHVDLTCKVAQLEFRYGSVERGKALFEEIITNLPRRTDIWSIYIDACIKHTDIVHARMLFDRVSSLKLHPKPMSLFMRRFLEFEQKFGTEQSIEAVKRKAITYCEQG